MKIQANRWLWVVVTLQVVFLLGWAGYHENVRHTAPTIRLQTKPVDPRDLLRGDYMILNYAISSWTPPVASGEMLNGEVFVMLKPEGVYQVIDAVLSAEPGPDDKRLWVRATSWRRSESLRLDYGIERFFVPEGRGTPKFKQMEVEASVSATHRLYIRHVWLDGKVFP